MASSYKLESRFILHSFLNEVKHFKSSHEPVTRGSRSALSRARQGLRVATSTQSRTFSYVIIADISVLIYKNKKY